MKTTLKTWSLRCAASLVCSITICWSAWAATPANDNFADAAPISFPQDNVTSVTGSNTDATREPGEPWHADNPGGASVWWKFIPAQSGYLTLSTERSVSALHGQALDSLLTVYTGDALTELELVDWNDNDDETGEWWSRLRIPVSAGIEYYIAVDGYKDDAFGPDHGQIVLDLHFSTTVTFENAPAWQLPDLEGNTVQSADFTNQVVLLNFWATWCPACTREIPELIELQEKFRSLGLAVVGISIDDPMANKLPIQRVSAYLQNFEINYPIVMTRPGGNSVESDFGLFFALGDWIPTSLIVDRKNRIVRRIAGGRDFKQWQQILLPHLLDSMKLRASRADGRITLTWPTVPAEVQVQSSEQLPPTSWTPVVGTRTDDGQTTWFTVEEGPTAVARFFRLRVDP
jgi:thiol-disulfide isomerase/thioredoxin